MVVLASVLVMCVHSAIAQQEPLRGLDLTEHNYASPGDWKVNYYTDPQGNFVCATCIKDGSSAGEYLRLIMTDDFMALEYFVSGVAPQGRVKMYYNTQSPAEVDSLPRMKTVYGGIGREQDAWTRVYLENLPSTGDLFSNSKTLSIQGKAGIVQYDLKGSNVACKKMLECFANEGKASSGAAKPMAGNQIQVSFANHSGYEVGFFLNGGGGVEARLADGKTESWTVTVDPGQTPIVRIHQVQGESLEFTLEHGGEYQFVVQGGKIVNAYR